MNIDLRLVYLRFDIMKRPEEQTNRPVGIFFLPEGGLEISNVFIKYSGETPGLPVILAFPELVFPNSEVNSGRRLEKIEVSEPYRNEYSLGAPFRIVIPDDTPKLDKFLFVKFIADHELFKASRPIYRFKMHRYFAECAPNE